MAGAEGAVVEPDGDVVDPLVILAGGAGDLVVQGVVAVHGLDKLLQLALRVVGREHGGEPLVEVAVDLQDDSVRHGVAGVEVKRGDEGLEGVLERGAVELEAGQGAGGVDAEAFVKMELSGEAGGEFALDE